MTFARCVQTTAASFSEMAFSHKKPTISLLWAVLKSTRTNDANKNNKYTTFAGISSTAYGAENHG